MADRPLVDACAASALALAGGDTTRARALLAGALRSFGAPALRVVGDAE